MTVMATRSQAGRSRRQPSDPLVEVKCSLEACARELREMQGGESADPAVELAACALIVRDLDLEASVTRLRARSARRFGELLVALAAEKGSVSLLSKKDLYGLGKRERDRAMRIASIPADKCAISISKPRSRGCGPGRRGALANCST